MNEVESEALNVMLENLGPMWAVVTKVKNNESPNSGAVSWWGNGAKHLFDRFAGYSLSREQCLAIYDAMEKVFEKK